MAFCGYCGGELSDQALTCPRCGHPNELLTGPSAPMPPPAPVLAYAGFGRRFLATLIDAVIVNIVAVLIFGERVDVETGFGTFPTWQVGYQNEFLTWFVYTWGMMVLTRGQTLGKMALGIRICTRDGAPVDAGRAAARQAMAIVSAIPLGLGFLWAAWDPEKRTWHDMVADTRALVGR